MERDMELIRQITLALLKGHLNGLPDVDGKLFSYHAKLMIDAGLAEGALMAPQRGIPSAATLWCLTWAGHDFADAIKSDTIWNTVKARVIKPAASWTFGILLDCLRSEITRTINPG
ncbi:MAG: DUF2513 domain-containing protein [Gammaproteobacteria bacterium]|nr:DUF2513 domain-containing protein [Gammaproteobacteria bacterium]